MYCKNCGAELKEGQKFCQKCGTPVSTVHTSEVNQNNQTNSSGITGAQTGPNNQEGRTIAKSGFNFSGIKARIANADRGMVISVVSCIVLTLIIIIILIYNFTGIWGYGPDRTIYNKDGLRIGYSRLASFNNGDVGLVFSVENNTGKTITDISPFEVEIDKKNATVAVTSGLQNKIQQKAINSIKTGESGEFVLEVHRDGAIGIGIDVNNISRYKLSLIVQYDLNGHVSSETLGPYTCRTK